MKKKKKKISVKTGTGRKGGMREMLSGGDGTVKKEHSGIGKTDKIISLMK